MIFNGFQAFKRAGSLISHVYIYKAKWIKLFSEGLGKQTCPVFQN